jgi:hypothetical protein
MPAPGRPHPCRPLTTPGNPRRRGIQPSEQSYLISFRILSLPRHPRITEPSPPSNEQTTAVQRSQPSKGQTGQRDSGISSASPRRKASDRRRAEKIVNPRTTRKRDRQEARELRAKRAMPPAMSVSPIQRPARETKYGAVTALGWHAGGLRFDGPREKRGNWRGTKSRSSNQSECSPRRRCPCINFNQPKSIR